MRTNKGLFFDGNDLSSPDIDNAGFHNSIYRGKNITSYLTDGSLWTRISSGKFTDLFVGDFFRVRINGAFENLEIAEFDRFYVYGRDRLAQHHAVIVPSSSLTDARMNDSASTSGGYAGSKMFTTTLPEWTGYLETALGASHVLQTSEFLTSQIDMTVTNIMRPGLTGASNGGTFYTSKANLLSETEVYGYLSCGSSGYECAMCNSGQLPLFKLKPRKILVIDDVYWLRTIASAKEFCCVNGADGSTDMEYAGVLHGVRPRFVIG